jgi:multiple sugar transport system ATP-binding protein
VPARAAPRLVDGQEVILGVRPEHLLVLDGADRLPPEGQTEALVSVVEPLGSETLILARIGDLELTGKGDGRTIPRPGDRVRVGFDLAHLHVFDRATERALS